MSSSGRPPLTPASILAVASDGLASPDQRALLAFTVAGRRYAVEMIRAREILRDRRATPLPLLPDFVEGVISLRGAVVPVLDLRRRLGLAVAAADRNHRLVVVAEQGGELAALRVEQVLGVLRVSPSDLTPPVRPDPLVKAVSAEGDLCRVLDVDGLLDWREEGRG